jgi:hypothetical protein
MDVECRIKVDFQEIEWVVMDWIRVALDIPEVSFSCEYGNEPSGFIKCRGIF